MPRPGYFPERRRLLGRKTLAVDLQVEHVEAIRDAAKHRNMRIREVVLEALRRDGVIEEL